MAKSIYLGSCVRATLAGTTLFTSIYSPLPGRERGIENPAWHQKYINPIHSD